METLYYYVFNRTTYEIKLEEIKYEKRINNSSICYIINLDRATRPIRRMVYKKDIDDFKIASTGFHISAISYESTRMNEFKNKCIAALETQKVRLLENIDALNISLEVCQKALNFFTND